MKATQMCKAVNGSQKAKSKLWKGDLSNPCIALTGNTRIKCFKGPLKMFSLFNDFLNLLAGQRLLSRKFVLDLVVQTINLSCVHASIAIYNCPLSVSWSSVNWYFTINWNGGPYTILLTWHAVWPEKNRQMSIKVAQKRFQYKDDRFWHICKKCLRM